VLEIVIEKEWEKVNSPLLEIVCSQLSKQKEAALADLFEKMVGHSAITIRIHGLRGIKHNRFSQLKELVESLTGEETISTIRKHALDVMEVLE
jgi:hypothetical protein